MRATSLPSSSFANTAGNRIAPATLNGFSGKRVSVKLGERFYIAFIISRGKISVNKRTKKRRNPQKKSKVMPLS